MTTSDPTRAAPKAGAFGKHLPTTIAVRTFLWLAELHKRARACSLCGNACAAGTGRVVFWCMRMHTHLQRRMALHDGQGTLILIVHTCSVTVSWRAAWQLPVDCACRMAMLRGHIWALTMINVLRALGMGLACT